MQLTGNTILITGGTSGIGRCLAEAFHALGNQVVIAGRRQALLDEVTAANPGMRSIQVDVSDLPAVDAFAAEIGRQFPQLNVLFNNAGISGTEDYSADSIDLAMAHSIVQTNILSVLHVTAAFLPLLKRQPKSTVVTTSSNLAFLPNAAYPAYCASKAFLHSWLQSVRHQLRKTSVEMLELAPPYVQTELTGAHQSSDPRAMPLADYIAEVMQLLANPNPPRGEIIVKRGSEMRWAETNGVYEEMYAQKNSP